MYQISNLYKSLAFLTASLSVLLLTVNSAFAEQRSEEQAPLSRPEISAPTPDPEVIGFIDSRNTLSLNGTWNLLIDPMGVGDPGGAFGGWASARQQENAWQLIEYNYSSARKISVPGDFNTQIDGLLFYRDSVWYQRFFEASPVDNNRYHLWFGGVNYTSIIFLNGKPITKQVGGYVPFSVDITEHLKAGRNDLVVKVNNRLDANSVPTARTDWWPYGGLTRDVMLVETPDKFIVNAKVQLGDNASIQGEIHTRGFKKGTKVSIKVPELGLATTAKVDQTGLAKWQTKAKPVLWEPDNPKLYKVEISAGRDNISDRVGFRTIETRGETILLNGKPIRFKGISTHEEPIGRDGTAFSRSDMVKLFSEAKALGANFVRAAHYPYSRYAAQVADEMGLLLWKEVPIYWNIAWENPETLSIARDQVSRLIKRDWNRASIVIWSVANETPYSEPRMKFLEHLINDVRTLDHSRLVSAALLGDMRSKLRQIVLHLAAYGIDAEDIDPKDRAMFSEILKKAGDSAPKKGDNYQLIIDDPLGELADIVSYNEYFGWYYSIPIAATTGISEKALRELMLDFIPNINIGNTFGKPMHISEFGAGAKFGNRGEGVWTEDYQAEVYRVQTQMISNSPQVQGMTPWVLKDFRAMLRALPNIQDYRNRKGLIDENGQRKRAFYVLRDFYQGPWGTAFAKESSH